MWQNDTSIQVWNNVSKALDDSKELMPLKNGETIEHETNGKHDKLETNEKYDDIDNKAEVAIDSKEKQDIETTEKRGGSG